MEVKETTINQKFQSNLNSLIGNTLKEEKMEEDLDFSFNNNASKPKKESTRQKKNKTVQHDENQDTKFFDQHILQWGKGRGFV